MGMWRFVRQGDRSQETEVRSNPAAVESGRLRVSGIVFSFLLCLAMPLAGQLVFPTVVERTGPVAGTFRLPYRSSGKGSLAIRWTDSYGRVVEDRKIPFEINDETEIGFTLDTRRAVAMKNTLDVHFTIDGVNKR